MAQPSPRDWRLIWRDEFDRPGRPDPRNWDFERGGHGWGNNELQHYTDRPENARIENGRLVIEARKEDFEGKRFTSARLLSKPGWRYGRFEVKAKLPSGRGTWPALWLLPTSWHTGAKPRWPRDGEIDLMEHVGYDPDVIHQTVHTDAYNHVKKTQKGFHYPLPGARDGFHVYALEWSATKIDFFADGVWRFTFEKEPDADEATWPFDKPFSFRLNVAVGGHWGGAKGVDESVFPAKMEIDYVRVYERKTS